MHYDRTASRSTRLVSDAHSVWSSDVPSHWHNAEVVLPWPSDGYKQHNLSLLARWLKGIVTSLILAILSCIAFMSPLGLQHKVPMRLQPHQHSVLLGHFPYSEAPASKLCAVGDTGVQLRRSAAEAFQRMRVAAYVDAGVVIFPVSGFRSAEEQHEVFVAGKAAAGQSTADRARVSAPPLHTEHSTGYAVDIGTDSVSEQLDESFETTLAFAWLQAHAHRFGFELSFQRGNAQGIAHEPWHWRYVGNAHAWWTFHPAIRI